MGAKLLVCFLLVVGCVSGLHKIKQRSFTVNMNDIVDANLEFAQAMYPISNVVDGNKLFEEVTLEDATYTNISVDTTSKLLRISDILQIVDLDLMRNDLRGTLGVDVLLLRVGMLSSLKYFGPTRLTDIGISVSKPTIDFEITVSPTQDKACAFAISANVKMDGVATLISPYTFYNGTDISGFFRSTFNRHLNEQLRKLPHDVTTGHCNPVLYAKRVIVSYISKIN